MTQPKQTNIVLTGFMGTGKTTIGKAVAARLGLPFVDTDDLVARLAGKPVPEIFAQDGEQAFRVLEARVCRELSAPSGWVIAAGGGAVLDADNRDALAAGGTVICLDAEPQTIEQRLAGQNGRPLLAGPERANRIAALLSQRSGAYDAIPLHLNTSRLTVAAAAEQVMGMAAGLPEGGHRLPVWTSARPVDGDGETVSFSPQVGYDVLIAEGLLSQAGQRLVEAGLRPGRCAIVTNPTVGVPYAARLSAALSEAGFEPGVYEVPDGEEHKTLAVVSQLYDRLAAARLARGEPVIALGGGVTGDMAGLVAATWLRGVPFVQVPTSLLAMVDASIGGKVGVDLPAGKNLVGAFKQPELVLIDPQVLGTLPNPEFRAGLAEVLKGAMVGAPALFEQLAGDGPASLVSMIADAARVKIGLVERDPFEQGDRAWLNLGHTFGHALELYSEYKLRHGEGVALGLIAASELSVALGHCERGLPVRVRDVVARLGLPASYPFEPARAVELMGLDKKRAGRDLRFVLPRRIGEMITVSGVPEEPILAALETIRGA